jgi:hypothetical protein
MGRFAVLGFAFLVVTGMATAVIRNTPYGYLDTETDYGDAPDPYCVASNSGGFEVLGGEYVHAFFLGPDNHADDGVRVSSKAGESLKRLEAGSQFEIELDLSFYGAFVERTDNYVRVWVDWNIDGDWDDPGELLRAEQASDGDIASPATWYGYFVNDHNDEALFGARFQDPGDTVTLDFTASPTLTSGTTWMRVLLYYPHGGYHPEPCEDEALSHEGEIEDYPIQLRQSSQ